MIEHLSRLAVDAGLAILVVREAGIDVALKSDDTPVTQADRRAEAIILEGLAANWPEIPVVAEEAVCDGRCPERTEGRFFLVDALDGTREFVSGRHDFTVNIALVEDGTPVVGVVYAPMRGTLWAAAGDKAWTAELASDGSLGERKGLGCRAWHMPPCIVASKSHRTAETDQFIAGFEGATTSSIGSSLKFCLLAEGEADLYPRFGPTMEWDTAAGDAVLRAAGGLTVTRDGVPLAYGKKNIPGKADFSNPFFIAASREGLGRLRSVPDLGGGEPRE
ncbi:MAG: 3'(2'),5'-bisphosphate nucleotidase [Rhizobiales bacterium]|nr:3'(2'),5'-bisphosphate nucleotidase [Hyphomicrobiales bacterium]MBA69212.1 3'(2'),5'-bisphosphate nucleotidase [Hyphomicrobiales bacterium]